MTDLVVDMLAAARLSRLVRTDTITATARESAIRRAYARQGQTMHPSVSRWSDHAVLDRHPPMLVEWLRCPWCVAVWAAAATVVARAVAPRAWSNAARVLAVAYVAGAAEQRLDP